MKKVLQIVVIGTGNVSQHLLKALWLNNNHQIIQIFNHQKTTIAKKLAKQYQCELVSRYTKINTTADMYFICVKDEAIKDVAQQLGPLKLKGIVVHTSGSTDISVLKKTVINSGVFYPLQSFSANSVADWQTIPILIEASNKTTLAQLKSLALQLSAKVKIVNSQKRMQFHLAAVFANNFTNALYLAAFQLIETSFSKKDCKLLEPLILQSFHKMLTLSPLQAQTGPAKRNDTVTMNKHLSALAQQPTLKKTYKLLSELIVEQQKAN